MENQPFSKVEGIVYDNIYSHEMLSGGLRLMLVVVHNVVFNSIKAFLLLLVVV